MSENTRQQRERRQQLASLQLMFTIALTLGMLLAFQFASRITEAQPMRAEYARVSTEVATLELQREDLRQELTDIQSDAYVETWARSEAKMIRPGEVLVFLLNAESEQGDYEENSSTIATMPETNIVSQEATLSSQDNWLLWWQLFFDQPFPGTD